MCVEPKPQIVAAVCDRERGPAATGEAEQLCMSVCVLTADAIRSVVCV